MRQITIRQLARQANEANIKAWMPCEITCDGEVIAVLTSPSDVRQTAKAITMSDKVIPGSYTKAYQLRRK